MPSRIVEVSLILAVGTIAIAIAYTYILPLLSTTFQTVDVKTLENNYVQLMTILEKGGSIKSAYSMNFSKNEEGYHISFSLDGENLLEFDFPIVSVSSNIKGYKGFYWINLVGDNSTYAFSNRPSFTISGFKYDNSYIYLLYAKPSIDISREEISDKVSVYRILIILNNYTLREFSEIKEKILISKDTAIFIETIETISYPTLVWSSEKILTLEISNDCSFFKRTDKIVYGDQNKINIYEIQIKIINKNIIIGS